MPEERVAVVLRKLEGWEHVIWTTHKHGSQVAEDKPRLRVVLPLASPLVPSDHASAWAGLNVLVGGINDPRTRDVGRLHFLPSTFDESVAYAYHFPGQWIKLEDLPDAEARPISPDTGEALQEQALAGILNKARIMPKGHPLKDPITGLLAGEPFAEEGGRHDTAIRLTMWAASVNRRLTRATLDQLFGASLRAMSVEAAGAPTLEEIVISYEGAVEKLEKAESEYKEEKAREAREFQIKQAGHFGPYDSEDLEKIAGKNSWLLEELRTRWIIQRDGTAWFLGEDGDYQGPYSRDDVPLAASEYLARVPAIRLVEATKNGFRYRPFMEIAREFGSLADRVVSDMTAQRTRYDPTTRTMYEAILPLRTDLDPEEDPEIDRWLRILGGPMYEKLINWIACCSDLKKLLCAIYFEGAPGSGKTLFAHGMAKLWTDGPPADIESVLSEFNDEIVRCPLIIADEEIPRRHRQTATTVLRSMLSTTSRTLRRKYRPTSEVRGAVRIVLTANNEFLLDSRDVSSPDDLDATAQRFLYVSVTQEATEYLEKIPRTRKELWMKEGIARHALWLQENHAVDNPGKRFWVEGDVSQMHRLLMTGSRWNSLCCEWLVKYLMEPKPFDQLGTGLIRRGEEKSPGELLVNDQALTDHWDMYLNTKQEAETAKIGAALRAISKTTRRRQLRWEGKQIRYRSIDPDHLVSWADRYNIGDAESLLSQLKGEIDRGSNVVDIRRGRDDREEGREEDEDGPSFDPDIFK
ncbi:MAG: hypothetical protein GWM98_04815 [Nitrospinaceae bacterium]|nr:hypothetical protein [Deltaproteobacteria bacterium]NIY14242.1 hypothetical protein [Nitrospinaceae bacterium]